MSATYDPTLATDMDWVRFLIYDRDTAAARLQDEEILAVLVEEANKYLAAARCGEILLARSFPGDITSKKVAELSLAWGGTMGRANSYEAYLKQLREYGTWLLLPSPKLVESMR